jgi:hypothetical protein
MVTSAPPPAFSSRGSALLGQAHEGVGGHVHRQREAVGGGVDHAAMQVVALGEGHAVDGEVELPVACASICGEGGVHGLGTW